MVDDWTRTVVDAMSEPSSSSTASTPSVSNSMVITMSTPATASAAVAQTVAPSAANGAALAAVRFQARTRCPARRSERAMPVPMMPVPSTATVVTAPVCR